MKTRFFPLQILSIFLALSACIYTSSSPLPPTLKPLNEFTQGYNSLTDKNADSLVEITQLTSPSFNRPILKVGYISEENVILGIYSDGGTIVGWNLASAAVVFTNKLGIATSKVLTLIASGKKLVGATAHRFEYNGPNLNLEYVNGVGLWDVHTGVLIKCVTFPCQDTDPPGDGFLGIVPSSDGEWMATFSEGSIGLSGLSDNSPGLFFDINDLDAPYQWSIGSVAFDERNRRYAVVFQEGRIYVSNGERSVDYRLLARGTKNDRVSIIDAQIDPTGHWLVMARGDKTRVLNLDNGKLFLEITTQNPVFVFDRTGEFLLLGANNRLMIYSVAKGREIAEYDASGITSLAVSEDNRLVIWGDMQGRIHVWGKPVP